MRITLILLSVLLASCSYLSVPVLSPYKMDIRQGNFVTPEMREKLKLGMTKHQVRYVLGTPMINDVFHGNRWDYVYRLEQHGKVVEKQHLVLLFNGENLARIEDGDHPAQVAQVIVQQPVVPSVIEPVAAPIIAKAPQPEPVVEASQSQPVVEAPKPQAVVEVPQLQPVVKSDSSADVIMRVQSWVEAWSSRDMTKYLASYADTFKPSGMDKSGWEAQRRERIGKAKSIMVKVSDLNIKLHDDSHASATFNQDYRSDSYKDSTRKTLQLEKIGGVWLIAVEQVNKK